MCFYLTLTRRTKLHFGCNCFYAFVFLSCVFFLLLKLSNCLLFGSDSFSFLFVLLVKAVFSVFGSRARLHWIIHLIGTFSLIVFAIRKCAPHRCCHSKSLIAALIETKTERWKSMLVYRSDSFGLVWFQFHNKPKRLMEQLRHKLYLFFSPNAICAPTKSRKPGDSVASVNGR